MNNSACLIACLVIGLSGGHRAYATDMTAAAAKVSGSENMHAPLPTTAERIKQIQASGRTGLWSSTTEVCRKEAVPGLRTVLTWNLAKTAVTRVIVSAVDNKGVERTFYQGEPVGERETGPWLWPGVTFKIRDYDSQSMLSSIVIGEKPC